MSSIFSRKPALRLTLSDSEVTLARGHSDAPLATASVGAPDFAARMEALAQCAREAGGRLTVVLPKAEVWRGALPLAGRGAAARRAAARRSIAAEHGMDPDALNVALGRRGADGRGAVAAVHRDTLDQTLRFLGRWSLTPQSLVGAGDFPGFAAPPCLLNGARHSPAISPLPAVLSRLRGGKAAMSRPAIPVAAGAAMLLALFAAGWSVWPDAEAPQSQTAIAVQPQGADRPAAEPMAAVDAAGLEPKVLPVPVLVPAPEPPAPRAPVTAAALQAPASPAARPQTPRLPRQITMAARNLPDRPVPVMPAPAAEAAPGDRLAALTSPAPRLTDAAAAPARVDSRPEGAPMPRPAPEARSAAPSQAAPAATQPAATDRPRRRPGGSAALADAISEAVIAARAAGNATAGPTGAALAPEPRRATPARAVAAQQTPASPARIVRAAPVPTRQAAAALRTVASSQVGLSRGAISLVGVFGTPSARRALVRVPGAGVERVRQGDSIQGYRVAAVGEDSVRLIDGARDLLLKLPE